MKLILNTILNTVLWVVIVVLLFLVTSGLYQHFFREDSYTGFFGIGYAVVVSGSMEPAISVNDMILYADVDLESFHPADVIVYRKEKEGEEILITHRLIEKGETWEVKGDANASADPPVSLDSVVGKVVFVIPRAGEVVNFMKSWVGLCVMLGVIAILTLLSMLVFQDGSRRREAVDTVNGKRTVKY